MKKFIFIATYTYTHEYSVLKTILIEENIPFYFENETMVDISPFYSNAIGGIKLYVHKDYSEYVKELIDNLDAPPNPLRIV